MPCPDPKHHKAADHIDRTKEQAELRCTPEIAHTSPKARADIGHGDLLNNGLLDTAAEWFGS